MRESRGGSSGDLVGKPIVTHGRSRFNSGRYFPFPVVSAGLAGFLLLVAVVDDLQTHGDCR